MAERIAIKQLIQYILDDADVKKAIRSVAQLDKATEKVGVTGQHAGAMLTRWIGGAAIARLAQSSVVAFAKYDRGLQGIVFTARAAGLATDGLKRSVGEFLAAVEGNTGVLRQSLVTPFLELLGLTRDVDAAMLGVQAAANAEELGIRDAATAAKLLGSVLNGEVIEASQSFGLQTRTANGEIKTSVDVIGELVDMLTDLGDTTDDTQGSLGEMASTANTINLTLGEALAPAVGLLTTAFSGILKRIQAIGPTAIVAFGNLVARAKGAAKALTVFESTDLLPGGAKRLADRMASTYGDAVAEALDSPEIQGAKEELASIWAGGDGDGPTVDAVKARAALLEAAALADKERLDREAAKEAEGRRKLEAELAKIQEEAARNILALRIQLAGEHSAERLALELELLERMREARIAAAREDGETIAAIEEEFRLRRLEAESSHADEKDQADRAAFKKASGWIVDTHDASVKSAADERAVTEAEEAAKLDARFAAAQGAATLAAALFGGRKEVAIAQALVNTYEGVTRALAELPPPMSWIAAATTAALGLAQVQNIRKQDVSQGSGFDDPANDQLARVGGRRWAKDLVDNLTAGFNDGLAALSFPAPAAVSASSGGTGPGGSDGGGGTVIHFNGPVLGGAAGVRQFERLRQRYARENRTRTIR